MKFRHSAVRFLSAAIVAACGISSPIFAQDNATLLARMQAMEDRIKSLEAQVQTLTAAAQPSATPAVVAVATPPPEAAPPMAAPEPAPLALGGAGGAASKVLNPDIAVIGDFVGAAGNPKGHNTPSLEMHESEVAFQAILDPYARADFFISFGEQGVNLEEGYLTFPALPGGFQLRVGKMRAAFGKVNTLHNHVLPWVDRPLVTNNLVGGEDGIDDAGFAVSRIIPAPGKLFLEGTAQLFRGDSDDLFHAYKRNDVSTVGHLRAYQDITESTNIDVGVSYARGHSTFGPDLINQLYGVDATIRWKPLRRAIYHSFVGRGEYIWSRFGQPGYRATPQGFYVSGDYQAGRRWFVGGRFDRAERGPNSPFPTLVPPNFAAGILPGEDTGGSFIVTYWPSEFSQIRAQLRRTSYGPEKMTANELLFQFQFSIGAHGAHPF